MSTCEINVKNGIVEVKSNQKLMDEILLYTNFNIDQSLDLYGVTLTDEFKELDIKNPTVNNIVAYITQQSILDSSSLTKEEKRTFLDISTTTSERSDIKEDFIKMFTVDGKFGINYDEIKKSNLITKYDLLNLENRINDIRNIYHKLQNDVETGIKNVVSNFVLRKPDMSKENPDKFKASLTLYAGSQSVNEVIRRAVEIGDENVINNSEIAKEIYNEVKDKIKVVQYETDGVTGELVRKQSNFKTAVEQSFDIFQDFSSILSQLDVLRSIPPQILYENYESYLNFIGNLEKQLLYSGLDVKGLRNKLDKENRAMTLEFADTLYNFLYDLQTDNPSSVGESFEEFVNVRNTILGDNSEVKEKLTKKRSTANVYMSVETNLSEEEMFLQNSLIKVEDDIYQKIVDNKSLNELYDLLLQLQSRIPEGVLTVPNKPVNADMLYEDLDKYVSNQAKNYLTDNSDIDTIKKMVVYKMLLGISNQHAVKSIKGDLSLDVDLFLQHIQKKILENDEIYDILYFSNRGLEARFEINEYTAEMLKIELSEEDFSDLVKYAKLSGNISLNGLTEYDNNIDKFSQRDVYSNNMNSLPIFEGNYYEENNYIVADGTSDFIKMKNELYEKVDENVYSKVERDPRYLNFNLPEPKYNGQVQPVLDKMKKGNIKINKVGKINDETIKFC